MYTYSAYGLCVDSEIPLLEFLPGYGRPDVIVRYGAAQDWAQSAGERDYHVAIESRRARFWFKEVGGFEIRDGTVIEMMPIPEADENLIRLYIEGMIMAM